MPSDRRPTTSGPLDSATFGAPQPIRRGSVSERFVKCSKPGCPCAHEPEARHGPYYSLTRTVGGRTKSRFLTEDEAELVRRQIEDGRHFRKELEAYWQDCERCADQELEALHPKDEGEAERGAPEGGHGGCCGRDRQADQPRWRRGVDLRRAGDCSP